MSYNQKHNEANGEYNRDGTDHNFSWNCGAEGRTSDRSINDLRKRQARNFLATLLLSQGVPMILAGDETGRTQDGNNNAYCHDSEMTWLDWDLAADQRGLLQFVRELIRLRKSQPVFCRRTFFQGRPLYGDEVKDIYWLTPHGTEMAEQDWRADHLRSLGIGLVGNQISEVDEKGNVVTGDSFLILMNAGQEPVDFKLDPRTTGYKWQLVFNSVEQDWKSRDIGSITSFLLHGKSVVLLRVYETNLRFRLDSLDKGSR